MNALSKPLPVPRISGDVSVEHAIHVRQSIRSYQDHPLEEKDLGQLLWAAQGIRNAQGYRNVPSAGALYPLELYTVSAVAISHYLPADHSLINIMEGDFRLELARAALEQEFIAQAPVTIVFTAVPARTEVRYGKDRSPRYIDLEIGHAAQNLMLQAAALELGSVAVGAFHDEEVATLLALPKDTIPIYLVPVGYPALSS